MFVNSIYVKWFVVLTMCVCCTTLLAQQPVTKDTTATDTISRYLIEEVVITGAQRLDKEVFPTQTLSGEMLKGYATFSVADALRYFSGIQVKDYGGVGGLKTINIRSMGTNHVGVSFDGIELNNAQNGTIDLGRYSLDNMESITMYNGQKSDLRQSAKDYGNSGSVYLQSRTPKLGDSEYRLLLAMKGGSFLTLNPSILAEWRLGKKVTASASAEYLYTNGKYKFTYTNPYGYDTTAVRQNGDVNALRAELGVFGNVNNGDWRVKVYFYNSERGYPGAVVRGRFYNVDRQWDTSFFTQGQYQQQWGFYHLIVKAKYGYDYLHYLSDPEKDESIMYVENRYRQQELYFSAVNNFTINRWWEASLATDVQYNTLNADIYNFVYPQRVSTYMAAATAMRFKHLRLQASVLGSYFHDNLRKGNNDKMDDTWACSPALFLSYKPWIKHDLTLRAFAKHAMRMPTFNDLYYTSFGNPKLTPETTTQYDLGIRYNQPLQSWCEYVTLQVDGYFNQVNNKIVATPTSNFFRWTMVNLGYVEIWGGDVSAQTNFAWNYFTMMLKGTYTYQSAKDLSDPNSEYYGGQIPYIPWNSFTAAMSLGYKWITLHYSFMFTGDRFDSPANTRDNYVPAWYTNDLSLATRFDFQHTTLNINLDINNLFNHQYEVVRNYPMPGTNFKITAQITIK